MRHSGTPKSPCLNHLLGSNKYFHTHILQVTVNDLVTHTWLLDLTLNDGLDVRLYEALRYALVFDEELQSHSCLHLHRQFLVLDQASEHLGRHRNRANMVT